MKDPAVLFYTADFITGTLTMSYEQKGKYITLLCLQHQKGYLTEKDMLNICFTYDEDIFNKFIEKDGKYYNERMFKESEKRRKYSESRRINRLATKEENNICDTYDKHMENINININSINIEFDEFWNLYDKKIAKVKCEQKWKKLKDTEREEIIKTLPKFLAAIKDKQFQPHPYTYLNQRRWEDELPKDDIDEFNKKIKEAKSG